MTCDSASTRGRLEADVRALVASDRRTTTEGERHSAEVIASRLRAIGAAEVAVSGFRGPSSWAPAQLAYLCAGLVLGALPGRAARAGALATAAAYELEVSGRARVLGRILPTRQGVSVTARVPSAGPRRRTLVIAAHHDAAHTGLVWHPRAVALSRALARRTGRALPSHGPVLVALTAMAVPARLARRVAGLVLWLSGAMMVQSTRSPTTPGANDNASGVAAALELTGRFVRRPLPGTEVLVVFPGGEEVGNYGMRAWLNAVGRHLDPAATLVLNLDAVGSDGDLAVSRHEGLSTAFADAEVRRALDAAEREGLRLRVAGIPNSTDAVLTRHAGLRTISLLSLADGWISNLHRHTDTVERVGWRTVENAVRLAGRIAATWAGPEARDA